MSSSQNDVVEEKESVERTQILTNERCNLLFQRVQDRSINSEDAICNNKTLGILFRTYSEVDLEQLLYVFSAID